MSKKRNKQRRRERIRASKHKPAAKSRWKLLAGGLVLAVLVFLGVSQLRTIGWSTAKGHVLQTVRVQLPGSESRNDPFRVRYGLTVSYQYKVGGVTFRVSQVHTADDHQALRRLERRYNGNVDVLYAPKDPALSTLSRMNVPVRGKILATPVEK